MLLHGVALSAELLLAATPDVAVIVRHVIAFPDGFAFTVVVRLREPYSRLHEDPTRVVRASSAPP
jgi:hypothetical protein